MQKLTNIFVIIKKLKFFIKSSINYLFGKIIILIKKYDKFNMFITKFFI
jgi:hypothetical protein